MSEIFIWAYTAQWLVLICLMVLIFRLMKLTGKFIDITEKSENVKSSMVIETGPKLNTLAPDINTIILSSKENFSLSKSFNGIKIALIFLAPGCISCENFLKSLSDVKKISEVKVVGVISSRGLSKEIKEQYVQQLNNINIGAISSENVDKLYNVTLFPYGLLINEDRVITNKLPMSNEQSLIKLVKSEDQTRIA